MVFAFRPANENTSVLSGLNTGVFFHQWLGSGAVENKQSVMRLCVRVCACVFVYARPQKRFAEHV